MAPKGKGKAKSNNDQQDAGKVKGAQSVNVRHILCEKHGKKEEALAKLNEGAKFDDVAREFSEDKARQGKCLSHDQITGGVVHIDADVHAFQEVLLAGSSEEICSRHSPMSHSNSSNPPQSNQSMVRRRRARDTTSSWSRAANDFEAPYADMQTPLGKSWRLLCPSAHGLEILDLLITMPSSMIIRGRIKLIQHLFVEVSQLQSTSTKTSLP